MSSSETRRTDDAPPLDSQRDVTKDTLDDQIQQISDQSVGPMNDDASSLVNPASTMPSGGATAAGSAPSSDQQAAVPRNLNSEGDVPPSSRTVVQAVRVCLHV